MDLIVDANILFAALISKSTTAELLFKPKLKLHSPEFILEELSKYKGLILEKAKVEEKEFDEILKTFYKIINIVPEEEYLHYIKKAKILSPDENDVMYFALALRLRCAIWSNDKKLKEQDKIIVYNTKEILELIN